MFSRNIYTWNPKIEKDAGLLRLVFGLGTRAVDRVGSDYPRMIPLSHPQLRPEVTADQIKKYSQKQVDVIHLRKGGLDTVDFRTLVSTIDHPDYFYTVSIQKNAHLAPPMFKTEDFKQGELCVTFGNLLTKTPFASLVRKVLSKVEGAYGRPVDMEFAWDGDKLYILQCRPLSTRKETGKVVLPSDVPDREVLFTTEGGLSNSIVQNLEYVVYVNPRAYDRLPTFDARMRIGRIVNLVNKRLAERRFVLMGPGRWGSNDINLGVRVSYSDINKAKVLIEVAFAKEGYTPEVSYGTHFFQDLVEADIVMIPLFPDNPGGRFDEEFLLNAASCLKELLPEVSDADQVVRVIHVPSVRNDRVLHVYVDGQGQKGIGFFGPKQEAT
jgi:hypothetical protein